MTTTSKRPLLALLALSAATFAYVTMETLPIGLLTLIARDLHTSLPSVGLLVTGYAVVVVLLSIPLTRLTRTVPHRVLMTWLLAIFVVATIGSALATDYAMLLAARLVTAITQALFWSVVMTTGAELFPRAKQGRAVSALFTGSALAPVLGVPAGVWVGEHAGWRAAFLVMSGLALATAVAVATLLPSTSRHSGDAAHGHSPDARRYVIQLVATALAVTGAFAGYTYVTAFLLQVSGFGSQALVGVLLVSGVAGVVGATTAGAWIGRLPRAALALPLAVNAAAWLGLYAFGDLPVAAVVLVSLAGVASSALPVVLGARTLEVAPGSTDMASAGTSSAYNLGIAAGSLLGGVALDLAGVRATALVAGAFILTALAVALAEPLLARQSSPAAVPFAAELLAPAGR
jgi:DHA1 family inner membrane transport protein